MKYLSLFLLNAILFSCNPSLPDIAFNPGLYLVHASTIDNQTYVQKFIKQ